MSHRPVAVEPVNDSLRISGRRSSGSTTWPGAVVVTTFSTPGGRPTSSRTAVNAKADRGVCSAGLSTMVQPAAIAGAIFRAAMAIGKFHGVISRQGPTGREPVRKRAVPSGERV